MVNKKYLNFPLFFYIRVLKQDEPKFPERVKFWLISIHYSGRRIAFCTQPMQKIPHFLHKGKDGNMR